MGTGSKKVVKGGSWVCLRRGERWSQIFLLVPDLSVTPNSDMSGSTQVLTERRAERGSNCFIGGGVEMRQEWQAAAQRQREQARQLAAETLAAGDHVSSVVALHAATVADEPVGAQRYSFDFGVCWVVVQAELIHTRLSRWAPATLELLVWW